MLDLIAICAAAFAILSVGRALLRLLLPNLEGGPIEYARAFGLGALVASLILTLLASVGLLVKPVAPILFALMILFAHREARYLLVAIKLGVRKLATDRHTLWVAVGVVILLLPGLLLSLCPPYAKDALVYHLHVPSVYIEAGGFQAIPGNMYANFPQGMEMLFSWGMLLGLDRFPALVHLCFLIFVLAAVYGWIEKIAGRGAAAVATLALAATPSLVITASWAYVDLALCLYLVLALDAVAGPREDRSGPWTLLAGLFCGAAFSAKYTGFLVPLGVSVLLLAEARRAGWKTFTVLKKFSVIFGLCLLVSLPWLVKNVVYTGNPIFPMLYGIFDGRGWDAYRAAEYWEHQRAFGVGRGWLSALLLPINVTFKARMDHHFFDGRIGILYLVCLLPLIYGIVSFKEKDPRPRYMLGFLLGFFVLWGATTQQIRFLLPGLVLFPILGAWAVKGRIRTRKTGIILALAVAILAVPGVADTWKYFSRIDPVPWITGREDARSFVSRQSAFHDMVWYVNDRLDPDARLYLYAVGNRGYYLKRDFYSDSVFEWYLFANLLRQSESAGEFHDKWRKRGFTHILLSEKFLFKPFTEKEQALIQDFVRRHLRQVHKSGPYRLFEIL